MARKKDTNWSAEADAELRRMLDARYSTKQMAIILQRPESGVKARLRYLKALKSRSN